MQNFRLKPFASKQLYRLYTTDTTISTLPQNSFVPVNACTPTPVFTAGEAGVVSSNLYNVFVERMYESFNLYIDLYVHNGKRNS